MLGKAEEPCCCGVDVGDGNHYNGDSTTESGTCIDIVEARAR
jgi:hypothetical protein